MKMNKNKVILAETAGYCIGVKMAIDKLYSKIEEYPTGELVTYGPIIHNKHVIADLAEKGVGIAESPEQALGKTAVIRSHGVPPHVYEYLEHHKINYLDYTCPYVKKIQNIAKSQFEQNRIVIIAGDEKHPEIIGIKGFGGGDAVVLKNPREAQAWEPDLSKDYSVMVQTTYQIIVFEQIVQILKSKTKKLEVFNTICHATRKRQEEAEQLSKNVDIMLVLGDVTSSNSNKLYEICKKNCQKTFFIENIGDLELNNIPTSGTIGVTAGASTPAAIIKEAFKQMNELDKQMEQEEAQSFEEMLDSSFVTLHAGDVVPGTVLQITNNEVTVNLGSKADGIITKDELSNEPDVDPHSLFKVDDQIEVYVVKISDGDGNVQLSYKRLEEQKNMVLLAQAFEEKTPMPGKITDVVKGGLIAQINGIKLFVPSSQISSRFVDDLTKFKDQEMNFHIIEFNPEKRRLVAGRKELAQQEELEKKQRALDNLEEGQEIEGTVSRIVNFGIFVDLGDIDGLIHNSEISWSKNRRPTAQFKVGEAIKAVILKIDKENLKVSLSIRELLGNPWKDIEERYPVNSIIKGKVVRLVKFGAFVELENGIDGLIHISQISHKRINKAEDVLSLNQDVQIKVLEINTESKRISLSKKQADEELGLVDMEEEQEASKTQEKVPQEESPAEIQEAVPQEETPAETQEEVSQEETPVETQEAAPQEETPVEIQEAAPQEETPQ